MAPAAQGIEIGGETRHEASYTHEQEDDSVAEGDQADRGSGDVPGGGLGVWNVHWCSSDQELRSVAAE